MKKRRNLSTALGLLAAFILWTAAVSLIDVQPIGPQGSSVGLAALNGFVHRAVGVHMGLYVLTDWLSLVPLCLMAAFAALGLAQWGRRRRLRRVDRSLLALGGFYLTVLAAYLLFEVWVVNYRPVLIEGMLEASYPSSTTLLVLCVMPTAAMQLNARIQNAALRRRVTFAIVLFTAFMVLGRLISGVHWFTDLVGGALLSAALVILYGAAVGKEG